MPRHVALVVVLLAALLLLACGGGDGGRRGAADAPAAATTKAAAPVLARTPARAGEFSFRGEASPATHGPLQLDGTYVVRFEQYAPEDPQLDFTTQTPFTAELVRRAGDPQGGVKLFEIAARSGRRTVKLHARYLLDVSFGDFPYVVRFTPQG